MKHIYYGPNVPAFRRNQVLREFCEECEHLREHSYFIYDNSPEHMHVEGHYSCDKGECLLCPECDEAENWEGNGNDDD